MVPAPSRSLSLPFSALFLFSLSPCSRSAPSLCRAVPRSTPIVSSFRYAGLFSPFTLVNANAVSCFNFPSPHKTERRTCRMFRSRAVPLVSPLCSFLPRPSSDSLSLSPAASSLASIPHERIILHVTHIIITDVHRIVVDHNHVNCNRARG